PQRRRRGTVGVEGVDLVVHRLDEHDVVRRAADGQAGDVERLGVDGPVYRIGVELPEGAWVDVPGGQRRLAEIGPDAGLVVAVRGDGDLSRRRQPVDEDGNQPSQTGSPAGGD